MVRSKNPVETLKKIEDPELLQSIMTAVDNYDLASSSDWEKLDQLSSHTEFESLEANPDGIFEGPAGSFQAIGNVYVTLNYGDKRDSAAMSDSYPVRLKGRFMKDKKKILIEHVLVDTSSFFE